MTAEPDLLPLPEPTGNQIVLRGDDFQGDYNFYVSAFTGGQLEAYARANVAHATAANDAEIEALRAELREAWSAVDSKAGWEWKKRAEQAEARAERLAEALQAILPYAEHADYCGDSDAYNNATIPTCGCGLDSAKEQADAAPQPGKEG